LSRKKKLAAGSHLIQVVEVATLVALEGEGVVERGEGGGQLGRRQLAREGLRVVIEVLWWVASGIGGV